MRLVGILAIVGAGANLLLGCLLFEEGFRAARWCLFGGPVPDTPDMLIPLLFEIGVGACGMTGGLALLHARGPSVLMICWVLVVAGAAVIVPRNVYGQPFFGPLAEPYMRHGGLLVFAGLAGCTLPGAIGRWRASSWPRVGAGLRALGENTGRISGQFLARA
jgi:hypothetical protein